MPQYMLRNLWVNRFLLFLVAASDNKNNVDAIEHKTEMGKNTTKTRRK